MFCTRLPANARCDHVATSLLPGSAVSETYAGPERRQLDRPGRRASDVAGEQERLEMRQEITRLKAVVEILADAVQALTAAQRKPSIPRH
jgi:hypothetical protein